MAGWAGFTDDDLRKLKQQTSPDATPAPPSRRPGNLKKPKPALKDALAARAGAAVDLDSAQRLSRPKQKHVTFNGIDCVDKAKPIEADGGGQESRRQTEPEVAPQAQPHNPDPDAEADGIRELDETEVISSEVSKNQRFQHQQKLIEEANKQKKLLLSKTIEERKKAAKQEASKLTKIQGELNHLDNLLTADVSLLRNQIEVASIHFLDAQKRYEKAEKEFIEAKLHLYATSEQKELLTEHLYTIIHQNEVRKAKKLSELMSMLEMESSAEDMELSFPVIPPLTSFNSPSTIHDPSKHHLFSPSSPPAESSIPAQQAASNGDGGSHVSSPCTVRMHGEGDSDESKSSGCHGDGAGVEKSTGSGVAAVEENGNAEADQADKGGNSVTKGENPAAAVQEPEGKRKEKDEGKQDESVTDGAEPLHTG